MMMIIIIIIIIYYYLFIIIVMLLPEFYQNAFFTTRVQITHVPLDPCPIVISITKCPIKSMHKPPFQTLGLACVGFLLKIRFDVTVFAS